MDYTYSVNKEKMKRPEAERVIKWLFENQPKFRCTFDFGGRSPYEWENGTDEVEYYKITVRFETPEGIAAFKLFFG